MISEAAEWRHPGRLTKNREDHRPYLHALALTVPKRPWINAGKPRVGLVFPSPGAGKPLLTFSDIKEEIDAAAELTGWRWHDLRRSFATALAEAGTPEAAADAILNHKQSATRGGVLGVYQRASRWPEQVKAMQAWGTLLGSAIARLPTDHGPSAAGSASSTSQEERS